MSINFLGRVDRALDRVGSFSTGQEDHLFLPMGSTESCDRLAILTRTQYTNVKIVKIGQTVLCVYKNEISNPEDFYTRLWTSRNESNTSLARSPIMVRKAV